MSCSELLEFYRTAGKTVDKQDGKQIYGDADMFFQASGGCNPSVPNAIIYNKFCVVPNNSTEFTAATKQLLDSVTDDPKLIFNKIITTTWNDNNFDYTEVPQFASFAVEPRDFATLSPDIQSSASGNVVASLSSSNVLHISKIGISLLPKVNNVQSFCMVSGSGLIYYVGTNDLTYSYNPFSEVTILISNTNKILSKPVRMISCGINGRAMACLTESLNVFRFDFTTSKWVQILIGLDDDPVSRFNMNIAIDFAGSIFVIGLGLQGDANQYRCFMSYPFGAPFVVRNFEPDSPFLTLHFQNIAPLIIPNDSNEFEILCIFEDLDDQNIYKIYVCNLNTQTKRLIPSAQEGSRVGKPISINWSQTKNQYTCFDANLGFHFALIEPIVNSDWRKLASPIQITSSEANFTNVTIALGNQVAYYVEFVPGFAKFTLRCVSFARDTISFFLNLLRGRQSLLLFDNGEIRSYTTSTITLDSLPLWVSSTNDQQIPTSTYISSGRFVEILPAINSITISKNGLYALVLNNSTSRFRLLQNIINTTTIVGWEGAARAGSVRSAYVNSYCNDMPKNGLTGGFTDTYPDPRCLCFNPVELTAKLFNVELLKTNPLQYELIKNISPCITTTCSQEKAKPTITGVYMKNELSCPNSINICSTVFQVGTGGSINAGIVNIENNCGSTGSAKLPCDATCPTGLACNTKAGFCALICEDNTNCGANESCKKNICVSNADSGDAFPSWAIALIVIVFVIIIIGVSVGVFVRRQKINQKK